MRGCVCMKGILMRAWESSHLLLSSRSTYVGGGEGVDAVSRGYFHEGADSLYRCFWHSYKDVWRT